MKITSNLWATTALVIGLVRLTDAPLCVIDKIVSEKNYTAVPKLILTVTMQCWENLQINYKGYRLIIIVTLTKGNNFLECESYFS